MRILHYLLFITFLTGCATAQPQTPVDKKLPIKREVSKAPSKPVTPAVLDGIIFGKADFRGVLKVEFVKLMIMDENNPEKVYELFFGDRTGEVEPQVQPHYFFLELPASKYRITSISIPVGTTLATEKTDISFTVGKGSLIYLGTLRVTGTDQKIRFGAVPLIRPGFEYKVDILNEKEEAVGEFRNRYPVIKREIEVKLMQNLRIQAY